MFGGVIVDRAGEADLRSRIEDVKERYGPRRAPVKWNFKDLKDFYAKRKLSELHTRLLDSAQEWRGDIIQVAIDSDVKIILACVEAYSLERKIIKLRRQSLAQYAFANSLQRVSLQVGQTTAKGCEVVLDWPEKNDPQPFCSEYATAFRDGKTTEGHPYHSGPLSRLGFSDTPMFQNMEQSSLLQLSDLVVGAAREYIEYSLGKRTGGLGVDLTRRMKNLFYGAPQKICGWGLVLAGTGDFRHKVRTRVDEDLLR